jgi:hypothetical protein
MLRLTDRFTRIFIKILRNSLLAIVFKTSLGSFTRIRIKYRWQSIDQENEAMEKAKRK